MKRLIRAVRRAETADIVFPGDRYRLVYEMPVDPWSP